jgi:hypothetical protein
MCEIGGAIAGIGLATTKEQIVQSVIDRIEGRTYLEIGVRRGASFAPIRAPRKIGVDPGLRVGWAERAGSFLSRRFSPGNGSHRFALTSDTFFHRHASLFAGAPVDVALVDGLHTYEQSLRDVENCLAHLSPRGVIVMHDCNPTTEIMALPAASVEVVRSSAPKDWDGRWCGDVWKTIVHLRTLRTDLQVFVLDCDYGVGIVRRATPSSTLELSEGQVAALTYGDLVARRRELLDLKAPDALGLFMREL